MFYHEAVNLPDALEFAKAIIKEINRHVDSSAWELTPQSMVPEEMTHVPFVWLM